METFKIIFYLLNILSITSVLITFIGSFIAKVSVRESFKAYDKLAIYWFFNRFSLCLVGIYIILMIVHFGIKYLLL
jgi:hypothetical protein